MFTDRCSQYAAAIAYRVLFSLFPLTIALVAVFGLVLQDDELRADVIDEIVDILPVSESGQTDVSQSIEGIASPLSAIGFISLIALLWGASGMMASIRLGLEAAMKVERGRPAARAKLVDFILVSAAGVLVLLIVGLSVVGAFFSRLVDRLRGVGGRRRDVLGSRSCATGSSSSRSASPCSCCIASCRRGSCAAAERSPARPSPRSASGARRRSSRSCSPTSRATTSSTARSPGVMTFLFFVYVVAWILLLGAEFAYAWSQPPGPPGPPRAGTARSARSAACSSTATTRIQRGPARRTVAASLRLLADPDGLARLGLAAANVRRGGGEDVRAPPLSARRPGQLVDPRDVPPHAADLPPPSKKPTDEIWTLSLATTCSFWRAARHLPFSGVIHVTVGRLTACARKPWKRVFGSGLVDSVLMFFDSW